MRICRSKGKKTFHAVKMMAGKTELDYNEPLNAVKSPTGHVSPLKVQVLIDECEVTMEINTGASTSLMSEGMFTSLWPKRKMQHSSINLQIYSKESLTVVGAVEVNVEYCDQIAQLPLVLIEGNGPTLLGKHWLSAIQVDWPQVHYTASVELHTILDKYQDVFQNGLGTFK